MLSIDNIYILLTFEDAGMKQITFNLGESTEAYFACTIVFNGRTLVLGGKKQYNQVNQDFFCQLIFFVR